jgi:hypothetical protein
MNERCDHKNAISLVSASVLFGFTTRYIVIQFKNQDFDCGGQLLMEIRPIDFDFMLKHRFQQHSMTKQSILTRQTP